MNIAALTSYYYRRQAYSEEAQAFFTAAEITDSSEKTAVNDMIVAAKASGIWTKTKALYPFAGGTADTHKYNAKDPRDLDAAFRITWNGTVTHSSSGIQGNGTTGYGNTHLDIATHLAFDNLNISVFSRDTTNAANNGYDIGSTKTNHTVISAKLNTTGGVFLNGSSFSVHPATTYGESEGLFSVNVRSASLTESYRNGYKFNTNTNTVTDQTNNFPFFIGARNNAGTAAGFSNRPIALVWISDGLTPYEEFIKYTIVRDYINARNGNSTYSDSLLFHTFQPASIAQTTIEFKVNTGKTIYVDWGEGDPVAVVGDGSNTSITSAFTTASKTYYGRIYGDLQDLTRINITSGTNTFGVNCADFNRLNIPIYSLTVRGKGWGIKTSELPNGLTEFFYESHSGGATEGSLSDLPTYLQQLDIEDPNEFTSDGLASLPAELNRLYMDDWTNDAISVDNLPTGLKYCVFNFCDTLTGSLKNITINDEQSTTVATTITIYSCGTGVDISTGPMKAWKNTNITLTSGFSTASVDGFLNEYAAVAETAGVANTIAVGGTGAGIANSARSAASDAAVTTLTGLDKTVTSN